MGYSIDGPNKIINLTVGTTTVSVRDLWSRWIDWLLTSDNSKYEICFTNTGADDIDATEGTKIPVYLFLRNGWKIKPQEANHTLKVSDGVLIVFGGGDPFINTIGNFIVRINYQQPVQAISYTSSGGDGGVNQSAMHEYFDNYAKFEETKQYSKKASDNAEQANLKL